MASLTDNIPVNAQRGVEQVLRAVRQQWHAGKATERRQLATQMTVRDGLPRIDGELGYVPIPAGTIKEVDAVVEFGQKVWRDGLSSVRERKKDYRATILAPRTYEEAPPIFDLAFSDDILSMATDYLGEVPVLHNIELWATPTNDLMKGSQYYHIDGGRWLLRRAKFLFNLIDTGPANGPFTFLPADISKRVAETVGRVKGRFEDGEIYQSASTDDEIALVGPAGTGAAVDSSRCFHFGSRAREGNRLVLMFHFLPIVDLVEGGDLRRTAGFLNRFGDDPVRNLTVPNQTQKG